MFSYFEGIVSDLTPESAVINCAGVGYELLITPNSAASLKNGEQARIYVTESIGEDHFDLYGFLTLNDKKWFKLLTSVSGIGPKAAMSILSYNSGDTISAAIIASDEKAFSACPGIGKKTAQRIILELKDKVAKSFSTDNSFTFSSAVSAKTANSHYDEAISALSVLGYNSSDIIPVLRQINTEGLETQEIIREVLKYMV